MVNKDRKDEVRAIIESVFSEAPMANAIDDVKLLPSEALARRLRAAYIIVTKSTMWPTDGQFLEMLTLMSKGGKLPDSPSQHTGWSDEAVEAANRQCDNMAFVINNIGMPDAWLKKFMAELEQDRATLAASSIAPATGFEVKPFVYGLRDLRDGTPHFDEMCVSMDEEDLLDHIEGDEGLEVVALYLRPSCISPSVAKESGEP